MRERVGENINRALHRLFRDDAGLFLLGEDVLDPYGGAFRITKGLSTGYPDRVLTTPLSENAVVGVGAGLALTGNRVVVEVMFGDFLLLAFDQLVNFAAKSVAMYGRRVPLPLVVRCPVGGNRGYGPTHSQNPQKHLIGVPHLTLYEMSPLHDAYDLLTAALGRAEPAVLFEDKVLYTQWHRGVGTPAQDGFECVALPGPGQWMRVDRAGSPAPDMVLIVTGGVANRALDAVRLLHERAGLTVTLLVPGQLYPFEAEPVLPLVESAGLACVAEEGGRGGSWGTEVAAVLHERAWGRLAAPVALVASADSVIPAAPHLEREVVVQTESIVRGLTALHRSAGGHHPLAAAPPAPTREHVAAPPFHEIVVPVLNPNDDRCMLVDRLVADGDHVTAGTPVATVETSKATADIEADRDGVLRWLRDTGDEVRFGEAIARLGGAVVERGEADARTAGAPRGDGPRPVSRNRAAVAAAVTASHRTIPAAFGAVEVELDRATAFLDRLSDRLDSVVDLPTLIVKAVAALCDEHPGLFVSVGPTGEATPMPADIGVAMDAGAGLYVPVVRDARKRDWADVADDLTDYRMSALAGDFTAAQLDGAAISVSLNLVAGLTLVTPLILPPQAAMVSVAGPWRRVRLDGPAAVEVDDVTIGLAYDHRVVNGREATDFLAALKALVEDPDRIGSGDSPR